MIGNWSKRRSFSEDDTGTATMEFVLWLPVFLLIIGLIVDTTLAMTLHSRHYDVARDASRGVALGVVEEATAKANAEATLGGGHVVSVEKDGLFVTTTVNVPLEDVVIFFNSVIFGEMTASVSMYIEASVEE